MSESWTISVGGRVYGPYSAEQMRSFHAEGRLAVHSLVARAGEEQFRPAGEDPELAQLFPAQQQGEVQVQSPSPQLPSAEDEAPIASPGLGGNGNHHKFGRDSETGSGERNRFVIIADMKSGSINGLRKRSSILAPPIASCPRPGSWPAKSPSTPSASA